MGLRELAEYPGGLAANSAARRPHSVAFVHLRARSVAVPPDTYSRPANPALATSSDVFNNFPSPGGDGSSFPYVFGQKSDCVVVKPFALRKQRLQ